MNYLPSRLSKQNYVVMAKYIILPSRLNKNTCRHDLSYQVDLTKRNVVMAKYIILPSRLNKNTCRHGDIYYPDKPISEK